LQINTFARCWSLDKGVAQREKKKLKARSGCAYGGEWNSESRKDMLTLKALSQSTKSSSKNNLHILLVVDFQIK